MSTRRLTLAAAAAMLVCLSTSYPARLALSAPETDVNPPAELGPSSVPPPAPAPATETMVSLPKAGICILIVPSVPTKNPGAKPKERPLVASGASDAETAPDMPKAGADDRNGAGKDDRESESEQPVNPYQVVAGDDADLLAPLPPPTVAAKAVAPVSPNLAPTVPGEPALPTSSLIQEIMSPRHPSSAPVQGSAAEVQTDKVKAPKPVPLNGVTVMSCAGDRIRIKVVAKLHGHEIGDVFPVQVSVLTRPGTTVDFDSLEQSKLMLDRAGKFELVAPPTISAPVRFHDFYRRDMVLAVRQIEPSAESVFAMQLRFANPGGDKPSWQILTTSDLKLIEKLDGLVTTKRVLTAGNTGVVQPRKPMVVPVGVVVCGFLMAGYPILLLIRALHRLVPGSVVSRHVLAWRLIQLVRNNGDQVNWTPEHYRHIRDVMREYLRKDYPLIHTMTQPELAELPDERVRNSFRLIDRVLTDCKELSPEEHAQLLRELDAIFPQPFTH